MDNNHSEQQIEHFATGRKAWLFSYDAGSAQASATLFSLVMTCRVNDVEPYAYLNYLFEHLPAAIAVEHVEALLPWKLKAMLDEQQKISHRLATVRRLTRRSPTVTSRKIPAPALSSPIACPHTGNARGVWIRKHTCARCCTRLRIIQSTASTSSFPGI